MQITASGLRQNVYKILDQSLKTGKDVEIIRKGMIFKIVPPKKRDKLKNLQKKKIMQCKPEYLIHLDWSSEWKT
ncbi:type II toxin-antitoxin system Phd/YefM family antitoxin [Candidatus Peregrinibacteria bacterium]|nr:type II toxin-antitoxin system Phd/YefM family antitoxin [Candidatus Peregrinibacteria bacterium]